MYFFRSDAFFFWGGVKGAASSSNTGAPPPKKSWVRPWHRYVLYIILALVVYNQGRLCKINYNLISQRQTVHKRYLPHIQFHNTTIPSINAIMFLIILQVLSLCLFPKQNYINNSL